MLGGTESSPDLSICVPTFNRARYLECLLNDLTHNIGDLRYSYELIIGDNASEDNTTDVVQRFENKLNIRYFKRPENVGVFQNISKLYAAAQGRYVVYLADDDLLLPAPLSRHLDYLESNHDVGAVFAPWLIHDRIAGVDVDQFYAIEQETRIEVHDHLALFNFLVDGHIFPEIFVARTSLARRVASLASLRSSVAFNFFVQISAMVDRIAVAFSPEPFYRQVIPYFEDETHSHDGHEEVKIGWDRYRGGLEYILARFAPSLPPHELDLCRRAIDHFTQIRMHVALRLRTAEGGTWIDNYYLANRLRSTGNDGLLPAPYAIYRLNAAFEFLTGLQPFYPQRANIGFFEDDPPQTLSQAQNYPAAGFLVLDRSAPLPPRTVLLVNNDRWSAPTESSDLVVLTEAELLAHFP